MSHEVYTKIFSRSGIYKNLFNNFEINAFNKSLNGGLGDLSFTAPLKFDTYQDFFTEGDQIKVYVADNKDPNGKLVYSGSIDYVKGTASSTEFISVSASGFISELALDLHEVSQNIAFEYSDTVGNIIIDIIDNHKTINTASLISYATGSIYTAGTSVSYKTYAQSPLDAIKGVIELAPENYFYYLDELNNFNYKNIPTTPTHLFYLGRDVKQVSLNRSLRDTRNTVLFSNGLTTDDPNYKLHFESNTASINSYGRRVEIKRDSRYTNSDSVISASERFVNNNKDVFNTIELTIIDDGTSSTVNAKNINPGDTCKVLNIKEGSVFTDNMLITNVEYGIEYVRVSVLDVFSYVERLIETQRQQIALIEFDNSLPNTYTT